MAEDVADSYSSLVDRIQRTYYVYLATVYKTLSEHPASLKLPIKDMPAEADVYSKCSSSVESSLAAFEAACDDLEEFLVQIDKKNEFVQIMESISERANMDEIKPQDINSMLDYVNDTKKALLSLHTDPANNLSH
eukprot:m.8329 g.8329  ORF g.8329 m.8329 type:complete len:135 (-) comp3872_c0_seq1:1713-2117(-)